MPNHPVPYKFEGSVKELLCMPTNKKNVKKLFYQILAMPLHELENKKPFKVLVEQDFHFLLSLRNRNVDEMFISFIGYVGRS